MRTMLPMGRVCRGNDQNARQPALPHRRRRHGHVRRVDGVEGAAEQSDPVRYCNSMMRILRK
jgi:hypothetical protein